MVFDVLVVLGGPTSHGILKSRLDRCAQLFKDRVAHHIVVSGRHQSNKMKEYLIRKGVPKKVIYEEKHSADTFGNAFFTKLLFLIPRKWVNIAVVTSDYHKRRTNFVFKRVLGNKYKIRVFGAKTKVDPLTWDELILHEDLYLTSDKMLLNNFHLLLMREQK